MNRLVIIGNGFDLAHGLPTSYKHFIDDFWRNFKDKVNTDEYQKLIYTDNSYFKYYSDYGVINSFSDFINSINECIKEYTDFVFEEKTQIFYTSKYASRKKIFEFKSDFFRQICTKNISNWVDIETEYYRNLIVISKKTSINENDRANEVKVLNKEFELIKNLLFKYLKSEVCDKYCFEINDANEIINYLINEIDALNNGSLQSYSTLFLSFNYTPTARIYNDFLKSKLYNTNINYIHGEIEDKDNSEIIFGYCDDKDENYKLIKNIKDNDFLENIKSFEYNNNDNFENLLGFINQSKFVVYLIGHSCGLSDKYLLNQILEHKNCDSIKALYRTYNNGTDDFKNKSMDISRHFDNDRLSTTRMVSKKKTISIPQDVRFKLKEE